MRCLAIRVLSALFVLTILGSAAPASAEESNDWPGWRGDGSGVSADRHLPVEWSQDSNITWKTRINGEGFSSPVISGDQVFLTTTRPGKSAHPSRVAANIVAWALLLLALAWAVGGDLGDPLASTRDVPVSRKLILIAVFLGIAVPLLLRRSDALGGVMAGVAATIGMFGVSHVLSRGDRTSPVDGALQRLHSLGILLLVGVFLAGVAGKLLANERFAYGTTWASTGEILTIGLLAILGWLDRRSPGRVLLGIGSVAAFYALAKFSPPSAAWYRAGTFKYFVALIGAGTVWFMAHHLLKFLRGGVDSRMGGFREWRGPIALGLLGTVFFVMMNFLGTRSVLWREVVSVNRTTGALEWHTVVNSEQGRPSLHEASSAAAPTMATDGELVFAHFGGAGVYALDFNGEIVWEREESAPPPHWGSGSSPILTDGLLIMTYDVDEVSFSEALDARTGETRWKADRTNQIETPEEGHFTLDAYSTPFVFEWEGRRELVTHAKTLLAAYDPTTGKEIWRHKSKGRQVIPTTLQWNDLMIVGGAESQKYLAGIRVDANGEQEILWEAKRYQPELSTPVIYDDLLYTVSGSGIAACRDPLTGEVIWRERLPGGYYASLVAADDKIYFSNLNGVVSVVRAGREFELLGRNEIGEAVNATPAIADGDLYLRGQEHLYRIAGPEAPPEPIEPAIEEGVVDDSLPVEESAG